MILFAKSIAFSQSSHKQEDCGISSFQAGSLCPFKNSYSWRKLRSRWNVSGKEAYFSLVITFDALIIPSKSRIFHRIYLFCLYWRLPWSILTYRRYRVCLELCKLYLLFPKNSRATLFPPDSIRSSYFLLCFLPLLSLIWIFRGLSGSHLSAFFILRFRVCFEENDDEVDGRSSSVSFWLSQANCSANFFFNRYSLIRAASFFLNLSCFFGSKYFLFFCSDLFLVASLILYSSPFLDRSYSNPVCFHHFFFFFFFFFWFDDNRRLNS